MIRRTLAATALTLGLSACAIGPDYQGPDSIEVGYTDLAKQSDLLVTNRNAQADWWARYNDPVLTDLMRAAEANNIDIGLAALHVQEARARRRLIDSARYPIISGQAGGRRQEASTNAGGLGPPPGAPSVQNLFDLGLNLSWEIDLFGRLERREEAADARLEASEFDRAAITVTVLGETALAYADLRGLQAQYAVGEDNIRLAERITSLTEDLESQDLSSEFDVVRARADVTELKARQNALLRGQRAAASRLALLTGRQPSEIMSAMLIPQALPDTTGAVEVGLSSDLLRRRPDIAAAERRLAAANEDIGAEMADLYPSFSLTGGIGLQADKIEDLFENASQTWNYGAVANWPVFNRGAQDFEIDLAEIRFGQAGLTYRQTVLSALAEVEIALSDYVFTVKEFESLVEAREDRQRAYDLAELRFNTGNDSLFPALEAARRLNGLNAEIAARELDVLRAQITLYRALGGGWSVKP
ncbi:MAG: efflux transporter outer membrane subunit [Pseudomonadota bacterium]